MTSNQKSKKHPGALAAKRKKAAAGKRVGKSKACKACNQLNRRVK